MKFGWFLKLSFFRSNNYFLVLFLNNFFWLNSFFIYRNIWWLYWILYNFFSFRVHHLSIDTRLDLTSFSRLGALLSSQISLFLIWNTTSTSGESFEVDLVNLRGRLLIFFSFIHGLHNRRLIIVVTIHLLIWIFIDILILILIFRNMIGILSLSLGVYFWFFFHYRSCNNSGDRLLRDDGCHGLLWFILFRNSIVCKCVIIWIFWWFLKLEVFWVCFITFIIIPVKSILIINLFISSIIGEIHKHLLSFIKQILLFLLSYLCRFFCSSHWNLRLLFLTTKLRLRFFWWLNLLVVDFLCWFFNTSVVLQRALSNLWSSRCILSNWSFSLGLNLRVLFLIIYWYSISIFFILDRDILILLLLNRFFINVLNLSFIYNLTFLSFFWWSHFGIFILRCLTFFLNRRIINFFLGGSFLLSAVSRSSFFFVFLTDLLKLSFNSFL